MPKTPPPYPGAAKCPTCDHWAVEHMFPLKYHWNGTKWEEINHADDL